MEAGPVFATTLGNLRTIGRLGAIREEALLHIDQEGLRVVVVDPAHVAMAEVTIPNSKDLHVSQYGDLAMGLEFLCWNLEHAEKYGLPPETVATVGLGEGVLYLTHEWRTEEALIDPETVSDPKSPELDLAYRGDLRSDRLVILLDHASYFGNTTCFRVDRGSDVLKVAVVPRDAGSSKSDQPPSKNRLTADLRTAPGSGRWETDDESVESHYSMDYLVSTLKMHVDNQHISLGLGNDYPLVMESGKNPRVRTLLAPRIEE